MAHLICGIDLGAFSVKLTFVDVGFRKSTLTGFLEIAVPDGDAPLPQRQADALLEALAQAREATPYLAVPGDQLSVRVLELPFTDPRKIDQVVGYELEGQIVHPLEEVVFDHSVVRQSAEGSTVLAVAARREDVAALLAANEAHGVHPRALYAASVVYRTLLPALPPIEGASEAPCSAILDLGHLRTNVCILRNGETLAARTIKRGGLHLTTAIAQAFKADHDRAEQAKRGEAYLISANRPPSGPLSVKLDAVLRETLAPTVRELRQTLASFRAQSKAGVDELLITGGTGRLKGLLPYLEAELGIPARYLAIRPQLERGGRLGPVGEELPTEASESESHALSGAIALAAARGTKEIDFRRGPFVYRASFSILRRRGWHLAALAAAILLAGGLDVGARYTNLSNERKDLDKQLKTATQELFGQPREDARDVTEQLKRGAREELAPIPKASAFDLLDQISRKMPSSERVKVDVSELDIRPKKTFIKGTVDSAAAVDEMATRFKEIECFDDVTKGSITEVSGGAKQFTLNVTTRCP
jgi:type IV pilus assembly protein PilM